MFALDIRGHLNSLRLAESKALWPLFEAVVNSIQSIEDSPNRDNGKITIFAQREDQDPIYYSSNLCFISSKSTASH